MMTAQIKPGDRVHVRIPGRREFKGTIVAVDPGGPLGRDYLLVRHDDSPLVMTPLTEWVETQYCKVITPEER